MFYVLEMVDCKREVDLQAPVSERRNDEWRARTTCCKPYKTQQTNNNLEANVAYDGAAPEMPTDTNDGDEYDQEGYNITCW